MRNIINISLPRAMAKQVNEAVKEGGFASKSEFFRYLVRLWDEEKLYRDVMEGERDIAAGIQQKCFARIRIFEDNPYDSRLRTHHLSGTLSGRQAFWIDFRYRVIFIIADEKGQHVAYFSAIGTHAIYD
ncbi:MAG: Plasmid stabilization system [Parcubacteria group bacterium GW2011_GWA2_47_8]|nr:MAG: Plasmid stabilization system [Parcubacteria group bacterium GW2011_GWA2_47_8]